MANNAIQWHTEIAEEFDKKYSNSRSFKERYLVWTEIIERYSNKDFHVIDLGCGSGIFTFDLAQRNKSVVGIDASPEMLKICNEKLAKSGTGNVEFINCNLNAIEETLEIKADIVVCSSVLEYVEDLEDSLEKIVKMMNPDGLLIFSMPNKTSLYRKLESLVFKVTGKPRYYEFVRNVLTLGETEQILTKFKMTEEENKYYGATPLLSTVLRKVGLEQFSDNLFVVVARLLP